MLLDNTHIYIWALKETWSIWTCMIVSDPKRKSRTHPRINQTRIFNRKCKSHSDPDQCFNSKHRGIGQKQRHSIFERYLKLEKHRLFFWKRSSFKPRRRKRKRDLKKSVMALRLTTKAGRNIEPTDSNVIESASIYLSLISKRLFYFTLIFSVINFSSIFHKFLWKTLRCTRFSVLFLAFLGQRCLTSPSKYSHQINVTDKMTYLIHNEIYTVFS